jgi:hypothetical protein
MSRSSPKITMTLIFDSENPKHRRVFAIIWYSLLVVLFCLAISFVVLHPPIDSYKLFAYTSFFVIIFLMSLLISTNLWSRPIFRRTPLLLIPNIFLTCIILYPLVTHSPIDYLNLFGELSFFAYTVFIFLKALARERSKPT